MVGDDVDRQLAAIRVDCDQLRADLARLSASLRQGAGAPIPGELTPTQAARLVDTLGRVGELANLILTRDLARTIQREDAEP